MLTMIAEDDGGFRLVALEGPTSGDFVDEYALSYARISTPHAVDGGTFLFADRSLAEAAQTEVSAICARPVTLPEAPE